MRNTKLSHTQVENRLSEIYHTIFVCKETSTEANARVVKFMNELKERTPAGARRYSQEFVGYARGFARALDRRIMDGPDALVEFVYRDANGVVYSTHRATTREHTTDEFYDTGRGSELGNMECAHVWKGTTKPFTPWTIPNVESAKHAAREAIKKDGRYAIGLQGTSKCPVCYAVVFCDKFIGVADTETLAYDLAAEYERARMAPYNGKAPV